MFQTAHARLAVVASALWILGAYVLASEPGYWRSEYFMTMLIGGWLMIWVGIFGVNWVTAAPGASSQPRKPFSFPDIPRPVYYALVLIAVVLVMGLPKAVFRFLT
jgi:hypothetical protein